jgi:VIT1/CCC1 family predicted Fe2+/Mn2+ transporter
MIAIRSSPASAPSRRPRLRDARHPHGGWREVAEPGAGDALPAPQPRPGAEALFAPAPAPVARFPAPAESRPRGRRAEQELLAALALAAAFAAGALLPGRPPAPGDLLLAAAAVASGLALLLFGLRFR